MYTTPRKSRFAAFLVALTKNTVPVDGTAYWEPAGALKFNTPKPPGRPEVRRQFSEKVLRARAIAGSRLCPQ